MCELCWLIFSNKEYIDVLQEYFDSLNEKSINYALEYLQQKIQTTNTNKSIDSQSEVFING